jgi:hypothetical protein
MEFVFCCRDPYGSGVNAFGFFTVGHGVVNKLIHSLQTTTYITFKKAKRIDEIVFRPNFN